MTYDFDRVVDRRQSSSSKWQKFGPDVLPMWVADMDFAAPDFVIDAIRARLEHPILGYTLKPPELIDAFLGWLEYHFAWTVDPDWLVWLPGVVPGMNLAAQMQRDGALMIPTPVYHPFLEFAEHAGLHEIRVPMARTRKAGAVEWQMDIERMQQAITPDTHTMLICNPQNPTGRCYTYAELKELEDFVERNELVLVSDEIHCNIVLDPATEHIPLARAFPEITRRTISLFAATKAYNIPGLSCAVAIIPDAELRQRFLATQRGLMAGIGPLGFAASQAAFSDRGSWLPELNAYLAENLALIKQTLGDRVARMQGTYLAWIDVSDMGKANTETHFARHGLGISPGAQFGEPSHVRLNFGCPRATLEEGLRRMQRALPG